MLLTDLLENTSKKYPDNIVVRDKDREISYRQLAILSSRLASCLIRQGVELGDRIGIYLDRSIEAAVAIFGILKAGAAYVPIDITFPPERKAYIIDNCSIKILIIDSKKIELFAENLTSASCLNCMLVMDDLEAKEGKIPKKIKVIPFQRIVSFEPLKDDLPISDSALANILYTSGSTDQPKGVMATHRALTACIDNVFKYYMLSSKERISSTVPLHFSMSVFEIFVTIKAGATICLVPSGMFAFPTSLANFIEKERLTVWHSVPSVITPLVLYGNLKERNLSSLRLVHLGGEVIPVEYLRQFMSIVPHAQCYNIYGSAETHEITRFHINQSSNSVTIIPVGKPWEEVEIFLVDEAGNLVQKEEGATGELYVYTPSLMQGYWADKKRTDQVLFRSSFHPQEKEVKIYRTGDIAKIDQDGNYVLIGRADSTIKRGGIRIGLDEIEAVLFNRPEVREAAVVVKGQGVRPEIKAVIVLQKRSFLSEEDIRGFCRKKLARYMVPDRFEFRDFLPRTSTGKIDKKNL
ncbi:MAG: amino acid adenylation domain-containing protein [Candidatus Omnitrophica bacterium]|nr:amino acid adenylation domain-containing protein [Candidatus Omnitrophota bacterium]